MHKAVYFSGCYLKQMTIAVRHIGCDDKKLDHTNPNKRRDFVSRICFKRSPGEGRIGSA
jgi:hypothetical protein